MAVHQEDVVDSLADTGFYDIVNHLRRRIIAQSQCERKGIVMSAVTYSDRRQYQHAFHLVRNLLGQLVGNQGVAAFCDVLAVGFTGSDCQNRFVEVSFLYLMCRHFK